MPRILAIAHRGFSSAAPENTLAAFRKAMQLEPDLMECDVRRSKDDHLVVIHDPTVDRTTDGKGRVADMTLDQLRQLDAGSWFAPEYAGERLPTLDEVLEARAGRTRLIIEIKQESLEDAVVASVNTRRMAQSVLIASFHYSIGVRLFELAPEIPFIPLVWLDHPAPAEEAVRIADEAAAVNGAIFGVNYAAITPDLLSATHSANLRLMAWTVDNEEDIRSMVELGVDVIASNDLALLLRVLSETGAR